MTVRVTEDESTLLQPFADRQATPAVSVEDLIEVAVERACRAAQLGPYLHRLAAPTSQPSTPSPRVRRYSRSPKTRSDEWCAKGSPPSPSRRRESPRIPKRASTKLIETRQFAASRPNLDSTSRLGDG